MTSQAAYTSALANSCKDVVVARSLLNEVSPQCGWNLDSLLGRLIELSGGAKSSVLTSIVSLILEAQQRQEWVAWIAHPDSLFYSPDIQASGIDLNALPIVQASNNHEAAKVADILLRSQSFALVVIDGNYLKQFSLSTQTRLTGLALKANTLVLCISDGQHERGSLVSFRGRTEKTKTGDDCFECSIEALKDKRGHSGWIHKELNSGTDGLS